MFVKVSSEEELSKVKKKSSLTFTGSPNMGIVNYIVLSSSLWELYTYIYDLEAQFLPAVIAISTTILLDNDFMIYFFLQFTHHLHTT